MECSISAVGRPGASLPVASICDSGRFRQLESEVLFPIDWQQRGATKLGSRWQGTFDSFNCFVWKETRDMSAKPTLPEEDFSAQTGNKKINN